MAKEVGKVSKIENGWMEVKVPTGNACALCQGKSTCTFSGPDSAYRQFKLPARSDIHEGDRLTLEIRDAAGNLSAFIIFGSPLVLFLACYLLINDYFQLPNGEIWSVIVTAILYGITLILSNRWFSRLPMFQPRIAGMEKGGNRDQVNGTPAKEQGGYV